MLLLSDCSWRFEGPKDPAQPLICLPAKGELLPHLAALRGSMMIITRQNAHQNWEIYILFVSANQIDREQTGSRWLCLFVILIHVSRHILLEHFKCRRWGEICTSRQVRGDLSMASLKKDANGSLSLQMRRCCIPTRRHLLSVCRLEPNGQNVCIRIQESDVSLSLKLLFQSKSFAFSQTEIKMLASD